MKPFDWQHPTYPEEIVVPRNGGNCAIRQYYIQGLNGVEGKSPHTRREAPASKSWAASMNKKESSSMKESEHT